MTKNEQLRIDAIEKLRAAGVAIHADSKTPSIVTAIEKLTGGRCTYAMSQPDYLRAFVSPIVPARQATFRPLRAAAHPRLAEIDQAQPPMYTPNGVGTYTRSWGGREGL